MMPSNKDLSHINLPKRPEVLLVWMFQDVSSPKSSPIMSHCPDSMTPLPEGFEQTSSS